VDVSNLQIDENVKSIFDATPIAMLLTWPDGGFEYVNPALTKMLGYTAEEIFQKNVIISHPDDIELNNIIRQKLQSDPFTPVIIEKRYIHKSGRVIPGLLTLVAQSDEKGEIKRFIAQVVDLTERKRNEDALLLFRTLVQHSNDCMFVIDPETSAFLDVNNQACSSLGYDYEELTKLGVLDIEAVIQDDFSWQQHVLEMRECRSKIIESQHKRKDGSVYSVEVSISFISKGNKDYIVAMARDITERKIAEALIWTQANFDPLTNLPNRIMLQDRLAESIKKANRTGQHFAVLCLDLDNFKDINDTLGHALGDELLVLAATRLVKCVRETDTVARMGGDEFVIILTDLDSDYSVDRISKDILQALSDSFVLERNDVHISASIGVIFYPTDASDATTLLKLCDQAMYAAKGQGKNQCHYFSKSIQEETESRMWLSQELHEAITKGQFHVVYQPIICLKTGQFHRAEALLRWEHPEVGSINPSEFISVAEENGSIFEIGEWVFLEVAKRLKGWRDRFDSDFQISVNTSPIQFRNHVISLRKWNAHLQQIGLDGDAVIIELTEGTLMELKTEVYKTLLLHREIGIQVAIDDFGTGYSSLAYLKKFDIDYLKIDQSFVQNLSTDLDDIALCEAIIVMAHKLKLKVIAEGVETKQQADILAAAGCDYGQGYYYSKGLPGDEFEKLWP
jgi:diguanylate cyclase (GGDEF)-like protein/PAS domain S-box-containing protein